MGGLYINAIIFTVNRFFIKGQIGCVETEKSTSKNDIYSSPSFSLI